ncbi:MAG: MBL fold metallo-hydrolase [Clostridia bacterium]|nr:MBL fold metallo-hydrolase [Clostridia bacterium]
MKIISVTVGPISTNCYIVYNETNKEAVVIDPGAEANKIQFELDKRGLNIKAILLTHGHFDHTNAIKALSKNGVKIYLHGQDEPFATAGNTFFPGMYVSSFCVDVFVSDGDLINEAGLTFKVISTPGHTRGSVCYVVENNIFSGDTLFYMSVGRTDFPMGNTAALIDSVKNKLFALDGNYTVFPGHGESTTLEFERKYNPYV